MSGAYIVNDDVVQKKYDLFSHITLFLGKHFQNFVTISVDLN